MGNVTFTSTSYVSAFLAVSKKPFDGGRSAGHAVPQLSKGRNRSGGRSHSNLMMIIKVWVVELPAWLPAIGRVRVHLGRHVIAACTLLHWPTISRDSRFDRVIEFRLSRSSLIVYRSNVRTCEARAETRTTGNHRGRES